MTAQQIQITDSILKKQTITTSTVKDVIGSPSEGRWISIQEGNETAYYYGTSARVNITSNYSVSGAKASSANQGFSFSVNLWKRLVQVNGNYYLTAYRFIPRFVGSGTFKREPNTTSTSKTNTGFSESWNIAEGFQKKFIMVRFDGATTNIIDTNINVMKGKVNLSPKPSISTLKTVHTYNANYQSIPSEQTKNWLTGDPSYLNDFINMSNFAEQAVATEEANTGGRSGTVPPAKPAPGRGAPSQAVFKPTPAPAPIRVEFGPGQEFGPDQSSLEGKPYILQRYIIDVDGVPRQITRRFWIRLVPNSFQYSDLSSQWNEVDRPGNYAISDWLKYKPLKASFKFLLASTLPSSRLIDNNPSSIPLDGLNSSVEKEMRDLRAIATAPHPISLVNFQPFLTDTMRYPFLQDKTGAKFVITDMSITASRFVDNAIAEASAAEVSISISEYIEPAMELAVLPPIKAQGTPSTGIPEQTPQDISKGLFSGTWTIPR